MKINIVFNNNICNMLLNNKNVCMINLKSDLLNWSYNSWARYQQKNWTDDIYNTEI